MDAHHWHSHALCAAGRFQESLEASRRIVELDPVNPLMHAHVAWHYYMAREYADALAQAEKVMRMEPAFHWGYFFAGWALERLGRGEDAVATLWNTDDDAKKRTGGRLPGFRLPAAKGRQPEAGSLIDAARGRQASLRPSRRAARRAKRPLIGP